MRRVTLDDALRAAQALEGCDEGIWQSQVLAWCDAAHLADCIRKRLGAGKASPWGAAHLGGRVQGAGRFVSDPAAYRRLIAVLRALEIWRGRCRAHKGV